MKKIIVMVNRTKDPEWKTAGSVAEKIRKAGAECEIQDTLSVETGEPNPLPEDADCALVLGGDGTMLQAARSAREHDIPLLGVNMGTLGYMAEVDLDSVDDAIRHLMSGNFTVEERMMLEGVAAGHRELALNDISVTRSGPLRVLNFDVEVNGLLLTRYKADGIILSTPTGSTGYNLSAGGPIVAPDAQTILLTPIAPHTLNNRSIVLSRDDRVRVTISESGSYAQPSVYANFDGNIRIPLMAGDSIGVARSNRVTRILRLRQVSFLNVLRQKLV